MDNPTGDRLQDFTLRALEYVVLSFLALLVVGVLFIAYLYIVDVRQAQHAVRRNYPVIGRFRYIFEHIGEFLRQYFFAMDREELPFNRAQRSWVYRAAKNIDTTVAFGSTHPLNQANDVIFLNSAFPTLKEDFVPASALTIGEGYCENPYTTDKVFHVSGMSFGAISAPAVKALSAGAAQAGIWLNTREGGLSPHHLSGGCDIVFQIGTAKYGVRDDISILSDDKLRQIAAKNTVRMFEIKLSQGAKPGKGGILPGTKVTAEIAAIRGIPLGADSISPNGHIEARNADQLLDLICRVRRVTGKPTGFKAVMASLDWLDDLFSRIHERGLDCAPDFITIDSADGGTGAAPQSLMDYVGLPIKRSLPLVVDKLSEWQLRPRIRIIASGKLISPADVAWALCIGADFVVSARGFMFALGCIQALQCNKNNCPTGVTTHDPELQRGLVPADKALRVANYATNIMQEVGVLAHSCGVREARELQRCHAQLINERGIPEPLKILYPEPKPRSDLLAKRNSQNGSK
jgi:glutamate synthase domain-containing protein 2